MFEFKLFAVNITPFGFPDVPDVYKRAASISGLLFTDLLIGGKPLKDNSSSLINEIPFWYFPNKIEHRIDSHDCIYAAVLNDVLDFFPSRADNLVVRLFFLMPKLLLGQPEISQMSVVTPQHALLK